MPVISAINNSIRAIERLTNDLGHGRRRQGPQNAPPSQQVEKVQASSGKQLPDPEDVVSQIRASEGVKANARVIQTADDMIGTVIDIKV